MMCPYYRGVLISECGICRGFNKVGTWKCVPIRKVSLFQKVVCTDFNGVGT